MASSSTRLLAPLLVRSVVPRLSSSVLVPSRATAAAAVSARLRLPLRTMASASDPSRPPISVPPPGKFEFLVVVPDKPGAQAKRLEVRPKHFEGLKPYLDSGAFKMGGAILDSVPVGDDPTKWEFGGSTMIAVAESKDEVLDILRRDIYTTSGVWDVEKTQIWPIKLAFRHP